MSSSQTPNSKRPPDPAHPDLSFLDGRYIYDIKVTPAAFPVFYTQGDLVYTGFGDIIVFGLYFNLGGHIALRFDPRWKVQVSRKRRKSISLWQLVHVEFLPTQEGAEARQKEMLSTWRPLQFDDAPKIGSRELRRRRRATKPSKKPPSAQS